MSILKSFATINLLFATFDAGYDEVVAEDEVESLVGFGLEPWHSRDRLKRSLAKLDYFTTTMLKHHSTAPYRI